MSSDDWERTTDDQICSFTGTRENPDTSRYERILQVRLRRQLTGLIEQIRRSTQLVSEKTDGLTGTYEKIAKSQGRQQLALILLSLVVTLATVAYTWTTWKQVEATRASNEIQQQMLAAQREVSPKPH